VTNPLERVEASFEIGGWSVIERIIADQNRWPTDGFSVLRIVEPVRTKDDRRRAEYRARGRFEQASDDSQQCRLARSVRPNDARKLTK
jgi:hypothetical protein